MVNEESEAKELRQVLIERVDVRGMKRDEMVPVICACGF